jgi:hypothetical protein
MAKKKLAQRELTEREREIQEVRDLPTVLDDNGLAELQENFEYVEKLRKTLLRTLQMTGDDLAALADAAVDEARAFAQLADDGPALATILNDTALMIELASTRLRAALQLRDDYKELFEHSESQLKKGLSQAPT